MLMEHTASHETTVAHTAETGDAVPPSRQTAMRDCVGTELSDVTASAAVRVRRHPLMAVALAFGTGLVLAGAMGWITGRPSPSAGPAALGDLSGIGEVNGYEDDDPRA